MKFWMLWGVDALIALVFVYFFLVGLGDGSVSSFNIGLWLVTLACLAAVVGGSLVLRANQRSGLAVTLLLVLAVPGCSSASSFWP